MRTPESVVAVHSISSAVRSLLRRSGRDITPFPMPSWFQQRDHLLPMLKALRINCVLDVGGHTGEFARFMRSIGYAGEIISFEPVPENFTELARLAESDAAWTVMQLALGRENGEAEINVTDSTDFSSMLEPNQFCEQQFRGQAVIRRRERVTVRTLDSILDSTGRGRQDDLRIFLKMDTQGRDLDVVEGSLKSLGRVLVLQTELSFQQLYRDMPVYTQVLSRLKELSFRPTGFFPVTRDHDMRLIEMDCVLVADRASMRLPV